MDTRRYLQCSLPVASEFFRPTQQRVSVSKSVEKAGIRKYVITEYIFNARSSCWNFYFFPFFMSVCGVMVGRIEKKGEDALNVASTSSCSPSSNTFQVGVGFVAFDFVGMKVYYERQKEESSNAF